MPHEREPRLVATRPRNDVWSWLVTAVLTAFALLAALIYFEPPVARGTTLTASERAEQQIAAFLLAKEEDVALVGSSLFHRLAPEYFLSHKVTNLALAGDSPLTGLAIVASGSFQPYAAALMKHPYATETIAMWQQQIASLPHRWLEADVDADKLSFTDGVHLDERSAILYIEALERALREQEVPRMPQSGR